MPDEFRKRVARSLGLIAVALLVVLPVAAFFVADSTYTATHCSGPELGGECDVAAAAAFFAAGAALIVGIVVLAIVTLWSTMTVRDGS